MTRDAHRLAELARLAGLVSDRSLAPVAAAQARVAAAQASVAALAARRAALSTDGADPVQAAIIARQGGQLRRRQADALMELARCRAELETAKAAARPDFGRKAALEALLRQARVTRPGG